MSRHDVKKRVLQMLENVRIHDPAMVARFYPHQISGGMGQRVMIAMMLITSPDLLIADEPTSALDVSVQVEILNLLKRLRHEQNLTYLMVSHSLPVVGFICERMAVMKLGRIVETCHTDTLRTGDFKHAYTRELYQASGV